AGARPSWAGALRAGASGTKGSRLPRRRIVPRASCGPGGGSVWWPSARATCAGLCPRSNALWVSVRQWISDSGSPPMAAALGAAYTLCGRVTDAMPLLTQALEMATTMGRGNMQARCHIPLGEAQLRAGHLEEAHTLAERALARARQERGHQAYALRLLGDIAPRREPLDVEQTVIHYRQALVLADELGMRPLQAHCYLGLGTLYAKSGQPEQARVELSTALARYSAMTMTFWLPQAEAALAQVV